MTTSAEQPPQATEPRGSAPRAAPPQKEASQDTARRDRPRPAIVWMRALRAYSFPASIVPTTFGVAYAAGAGGNVPWWAVPVVVLAGVLVHLGTNLVNDAVDFESGVDTVETAGGSGVLVAGWLSPGQVRRGACAAFAGGAALGCLLVYLRGWPLLAIGAAGIAGGFFYTAPPLKLKYRGLGDPLVFVMMGPLMVAGAALAASGTIPRGAWAASLPIGLLVTAILCANNVRDLDDDRARGVRTAATYLGWRGGLVEYTALLWGAYLSLPILIVTGVLPLFSLCALLGAPLAWQLTRAAWRSAPGSLPAGQVERTAQHHLLFGVLLTVGPVAAWIAA